jgi:glycosyltransferase involved in cell wall biosynthesis
MGRLLLLSPSGQGRSDGIAAATDALQEALQGSGHQAHLVCLAQATAGLSRWRASLVRARFLWNVVIQLLRYRHQEMVVCHLNLAPLARWLHQWLGIPYRVLLHGLELQGLHHESPLAGKRLVALARARQLIAVSSHTAFLARALPGFDQAPLVCLPNTFCADRFRLQPQQPRSPLPTLLTVCRLDASEGYKGVDRVLQSLPQVIADIGPIHYLVAGRGDDLPRLQALAVSLGLQDVFTPLGFVDSANLPKLYASADAFVMPSTGEGFGIVFLEAMACGTPVLAGNRDGSVDALDGGRLGLLVDPLHSSTIAAGILQLLRQQGPPLWFIRGQLSEAVSGHFGPAAYQQRVAHLFNQGF